jgi:hypothetical protein
MALYHSIFISSGTGVSCRLCHTDVQSVGGQRLVTRIAGGFRHLAEERHHGGVEVALIGFTRFQLLLWGDVGHVHRELAKVF